MVHEESIILTHIWNIFKGFDLLHFLVIQKLHHIKCSISLKFILYAHQLLIFIRKVLFDIKNVNLFRLIELFKTLPPSRTQIKRVRIESQWVCIVKRLCILNMSDCDSSYLSVVRREGCKTFFNLLEQGLSLFLSVCFYGLSNIRDTFDLIRHLS